MANYLGEVLLDSLKNTEFEGYTPAQWVLYFIDKYGHIDGDHHRYWVLKQIQLILTGSTIVVYRASWEGGCSELRVQVEDNGRLDCDFDGAIAP